MEKVWLMQKLTKTEREATSSILGLMADRGNSVNMTDLSSSTKFVNGELERHLGLMEECRLITLKRAGDAIICARMDAEGVKMLQRERLKQDKTYEMCTIRVLSLKDKLITYSIDNVQKYAYIPSKAVLTEHLPKMVDDGYVRLKDDGTIEQLKKGFYLIQVLDDIVDPGVNKRYETEDPKKTVAMYEAMVRHRTELDGMILEKMKEDRERDERLAQTARPPSSIGSSGIYTSKDMSIVLTLICMRESGKSREEVAGYFKEKKLAARPPIDELIEKKLIKNDTWDTYVINRGGERLLAYLSDDAGSYEPGKMAGSLRTALMEHMDNMDALREKVSAGKYRM